MKRWPWLVFLAVLVSLFGATAVLGATLVCAPQDKVIPGVRVRDVELGGLNREGAREALSALEKKMLSEPVLCRYGEKSWELALADCEFRLDIEGTLARALRLGREGPFYRQWQQRYRISREGYELPLAVFLNKKIFAEKLLEITSEIGRPPQEASFQITPDDRVKVVPGRDGLQVDTEDAYRQLVDALQAGRKGPEIRFSLVQVKPRRTTEAVAAMGITGLLSSYTTSFDPTNVGRTYNIRVAAAALDGLLVPPGQEVSFNDVVGPRSSEAGYKNAKVIVNNEFVDGIGGGVCQVSSTLYNAILLANLEVLERTNHSLPVGYVPVGRDATVVYGAIDLKFRNNTESYLYIRSAVKGSELTFKIYGNTDYRLPVTIRTRVLKEMEPKVIYEKDPNLKKGEQVVKQEGSKGYLVVTERVVWENGSARVEMFPQSYYQPVDKIIVLGTTEEKMPVFLPPGAVEEKPAVVPSPVSPAGNKGTGSAEKDENQNKNKNETGKQPKQ
jgi:vancomycin resistance protein YoaR